MIIGLCLVSPVSLVIEFDIVRYFHFGICLCLVYDLLHVHELASTITHLLPDTPTLFFIVIRLLHKNINHTQTKGREVYLDHFCEVISLNKITFLHWLQVLLLQIWLQRVG